MLRDSGAYDFFRAKRGIFTNKITLFRKEIPFPCFRCSGVV